MTIFTLEEVGFDEPDKPKDVTINGIKFKNISLIEGICDVDFDMSVCYDDEQPIYYDPEIYQVDFKLYLTTSKMYKSNPIQSMYIEFTYSQKEIYKFKEFYTNFIEEYTEQTYEEFLEYYSEKHEIISEGY